MLVALVCVAAGVGFVASARDSRGTDLRAAGNGRLVDTVRAAEAQVHAADARARALQATLTRIEKRAGRDDADVAAAQRALVPLRTATGLTARTGPGLGVTLNDASAAPAGVRVDPNQLVVHQSDLQAVVNALWAGGAEAMSVAGQRMLPTSAVRCVGNTLLLNGEVYSPPFRVQAIGPAGAMARQLTRSRGVQLFREAADYYGLGYTVVPLDRVDVPAYAGALTVVHARA